MAKSSYTCSKGSSQQATPALLTASIQEQVPDKGSRYLGSALVLLDSTEQEVPPQYCAFHQFTRRDQLILGDAAKESFSFQNGLLDYPNLTSPWDCSLLFPLAHTEYWRSWNPKIHPKPATPVGAWPCSHAATLSGTFSTVFCKRSYNKIRPRPHTTQQQDTVVCNSHSKLQRPHL